MSVVTISTPGEQRVIRLIDAWLLLNTKHPVVVVGQASYNTETDKPLVTYSSIDAGDGVSTAVASVSTALLDQPVSFNFEDDGEAALFERAVFVRAFGGD